MGLFSTLKKRKLLKAVESEPGQFHNYIELLPLLIEDRDFELALSVIARAEDRDWPPRETDILSYHHLQISGAAGKSDIGQLTEVIRLVRSANLSVPDRLNASKLACSMALDTGNTEKVSEEQIDELLSVGREMLFKSIETDDMLSAAFLLGALIRFSGMRGRGADVYTLIETSLEKFERSRIRDRANLYLEAARLAETLGKDSDVIRGYLTKAIATGELTDSKLIPVLEKSGDLLVLSDDLLGAMEKFEQAIRMFMTRNTPEEAGIRFKLGKVYRDLGRIPQAIKEADTALAITNLPDDLIGDVHAWLADLEVTRNQYSIAMEHVLKALEHVHSEKERMKLLQRAASISTVLGDYANAIEWLLKALNHADASTEVRLQIDLAHAYSEHIEAHKALKILIGLKKTLTDNSPEIAEIQKEIGFAYERQLKIVKAVEAYLEVIESLPEGHPVAQETLNHLRDLRKTLSKPESLKEYKVDGGDRKVLAALWDRIPAEDDFFQRLKKGLLKTKSSLIGGIEKILAGKTSIDEGVIEEIEELLILSDLGVEPTRRIIDGLYDRYRKSQLNDPEAVKGFIREQIEAILDVSAGSIDPVIPDRPYVIMVVGVNGVGKTTTIAKIAKRFKDQGRHVILAAGDTFRAGAIEQLQEWGRRLEVEVIAQKEGSDPSAVAWDAVAAAKTRNADILIIDTAGRLHTKTNLMEELRKVTRVIDKNISGAPHETLLVLDATTGQNAVIQAKQFCEAAGVTGIVLTKLDGTAKGGIIVGIVEAMKLPVKLIGIGERMDDLKDFDPKAFSAALFEE